MIIFNLLDLNSRSQLADIFDSDGYTDLVDHTFNDNNSIWISILYGGVSFVAFLIPIIVRFTALIPSAGLTPFSSGTLFGTIVDIMWIIHTAIWGVPLLMWPFTYIETASVFAAFYTKWVDYGMNWGGAAAAFIFFILQAAGAAQTPLSDAVGWAIAYPFMMGGLLFVSWWFLQGLLDFYAVYYNRLSAGNDSVNNTVVVPDNNNDNDGGADNSPFEEFMAAQILDF
jgi:hypothetical protein